MPIRFPYGLPHLAGIHEVAVRLRDMFPGLSVVVTQDALELGNVPTGSDAQVMHMAAIQLIRARNSVLVIQEVAAVPLAQVA